MRGFWMLLFVFYKFWVIKSEQIASFFGNSYISIPLQEAYASNNIEFNFRTWLPDAMFLLVAGRTDFCIVQLESGVLKLRINLGAGEEEISSPNNYKLNDGDWHSVKIVRKEANLTLQIDKNHLVKKRLPGLFFELNIQFGVFVGGDGQFKEQFLGHLVGLRGCMSNLMYGGVNLLEYARQRQGNSKVHGISWNCAREFDTTTNTEINFLEANAYVLLMHSSGRSGVRWQFEVKTHSNDSVLLYNAGTSSNSHTIAIEIINGRLVMLYANPKSHKVFNNVFVSDNKWHKVVAQYNTHLLELTVDTTMETGKVTGNKYMELSDGYFIGGIELTKRTWAMVKGVTATDMNFIGCVKSLAVNGESIGLSSAKASFGIKSNVCLMDSDQKKNATELEIISTQSMIVDEGKSVQIKPSNINLIVDYPRWGLRDNMVQFNPLAMGHGKVILQGTFAPKFTLQDLYAEKVEYFHDGSDTLTDSILFEVKFIDQSILPQYLQVPYTFNLSINVNPMNDPPVVNAPAILRMAKGTRKIITNEVFNVTDVDSDSSEITFYLVKSYKYTKNGQIEEIDSVNTPLTQFTQKDVDQSKIVFACIECENESRNENVSEIIILNVTDNKSPPQTLALKVMLFDLDIEISNNKGIFAVHNSTSLIQNKDLSFSSNIMDEYELNYVRIDVMEHPQYGVVECRRDEGKFWGICDWFFMGDVVQKRVRYKHTLGVPDFDEFKFRASINKVHTSILYNFTITFIKLKLEQLHLSNVILNGTSKTQITIDQIQYQTIPILASNKNIKFIITELPKFGDIIFNEKKLQIDDSFTQNDIEKETLSYSLILETYSTLSDTLKFIVSSKNCENALGILHMQYTPNLKLIQDSKVHITPLQVIEGEKSGIGVGNLYVELKSDSKIIYNITNGPKFGSIQNCLSTKCSKSDQHCSKYGMKLQCKNVTNFNTKQIQEGVVYYNHDDSETRMDYFEFIGISVPNSLQYVGNFSINVILKNDNAPKRIANNVLQVVFEQTKLLTAKDLKYEDKDVNTTPNDIVYTCQVITNGAVYNIGRPHEKITTFTQADLDNKLILFRHHGDEVGKISLWITDGQFYENGVLEVLASKPFVKIVTSDVIVKKGGEITLNETYIDIETNLNIVGKNLIYRLLKPPRHGYLKFRMNNDIVRFFNHEDIANGHITYIHNNTNFGSAEDSFLLRVTCEQASSERLIKLKILPMVYWQPLIILSSNQSITVEESTSVTITKSYLEVLHPEIPSEEIIYKIKTQPAHGYLQLKNQQTTLVSIDQNSINLGHLQYIQNVANQTQDQIVFDVTNGIIWLRDFTLNVNIIPEHYYIKTLRLNVSEGGFVALGKDSVQIVTNYYRDKVFQYSISRLPNHGTIQIGNSKEYVRRFSERDLIKGLVKYTHDNSENFEDYFEIIGYSRENYRESEPAGIHIQIQPVNDQAPVLVNNTGLYMWEGGCQKITSENLASIDADVPTDTITYRITGNWWGNLEMKANSTALNHFTQEQIDKGMVYFNHTNGTVAQFTFRLTDNVHTSKEYIFKIQTKPVKLKLTVNTGIHIFPLNRQLITNHHLRAEASDKDRDIMYKIVVSPILGRIVMEMENGNFYSVDNFAQDDVDNNRLFYEHMNPFDGLYANDSFVFDLEGKLLPRVTKQKFLIDISVSSGDLTSYIPINTITVDEGGTSAVQLNISQVVQFLENHANVHAPIIHATLWQPDHGTVFINNDHNNITTFNQSQLESNTIKYQHDHSDTLNDTIRLTLYLLPDYITLCTVNIPVVITPINDQPFKLITQAPHMNVVYGENASIGPDILLTEDPDTPAQQLEYAIINEPKEPDVQGYFLLEPDYAYPINKFTQQNINDGRVIFKHSGPNRTLSFHFRVWDGYFKPQYTLFTIQVIPISIFLTSLSPIYIQQGLNVATISPQHIQIRTNVNTERILYNITRMPEFGTIYVQDIMKRTFTHIDLMNSRVMYMQTNMTSANDTFQITAHVQHISASNTINVVMLVQPLMQRVNNFTAFIGKQNKIGINILDASPLAQLTTSNPQYQIVRPPTFGTIHKIIQSSGDRKIVYDQEVMQFNHEEIRSGVIYYILPMDDTLNDIDDLLQFLLIGNLFFQPAYGELKIRILSHRIEPELKRHRGGMHYASPNMSSDYLPIIIMLMSVVLLGISVIIIIKCRNIDMLKEEPPGMELSGMRQQPMPLPRPPDHLMTSSTNLKPHIEEIQMATHISLPHCKVTPLGPTESLGSSDMDIRSRYPYGSGEEGTISEDWCSQEAPPSSEQSSQQAMINAANPLLRRNQYWV